MQLNKKKNTTKIQISSITIQRTITPSETGKTIKKKTASG